MSNCDSNMNDTEDEKLLLEWNNYSSSMSSVFQGLREQQEFVDVTLVAGIPPDPDDDDDNQSRVENCQTFGAHKVILSACSSHLKRLLSVARNGQHPVLILKDISPEDLEAILTFVYVGRVQVAPDQLESFLKSAEALAIRGLHRNRCAEKSARQKEVATPPPSEDDKIADENATKRTVASTSFDASTSKRPRLTPRPPPKPVTAVISPALQKPSQPGRAVVVKNESTDQEDENFVVPSSVSSTRTYVDRSEEEIVIPSIGLNTNTLEDISAPEASTSDNHSESTIDVSKKSLCPLCRAVLSNVNALAYHMNYLHGISDTQFLNAGLRIKDDLS